MTFKVLLVNPNVPGNYRKAKIATANLGLAALSAYLKRENAAEVHISDARFWGATTQLVCEKIEEMRPHLIGISMLVDESSQWTEELLQFVKKKHPSIPIIVGSYFPTLLPEAVLGKFPQIDAAVLGEGEQTLSEIVECLQKGVDWKNVPGLAYRQDQKVVFSPVRELHENLDDLPFPDRYMIEGDCRDIEVMLEGTRGCLFTCSFCAVHPFLQRNKGSRLRLRSAESIFAEIDMLCHLHPSLQCFRFVDPDFISPDTQERAGVFARLMKNNSRKVHFMMDTRITSIRPNIALLERLKEVGLYRLYLGIESGSEKVLKKMRKGITKEETIDAITMLQNLGIDYSYGFMMITPWTLEEDIEDNIDLLRKIGRIEFRSLFHEMTLIPGTKAYGLVQETDNLDWCGSLSYYSFQTHSPKVEKFRKISKLLHATHPCLGDAAGYLYESIRQLRRVGQESFAEDFEKSVDKLFLGVFDDCWAAASCVNQDSEADRQCIEDCFQRCSPEFLALLRRLDTTLNFDLARQKVPKYAPTRQV
jgi:anaerobic magnesium-protoporphyrin IX monomethyl ester cyclase